MRGPRPPAARWPKAEKLSKEPSAVQQRGASVWAVGRRSTSVTSAGRSGCWRAGPEQQRVSPDAVRQAARERAVKLQQALQVLGDTSGPEVEGLRSALEKAKKLSSEPTAEVQITECQNFIARAEKRVADLDVLRAQEVAALEEGRARLQRLQEMAVAQPVPTEAPVQESNAEVLFLRAKVAKLEAERIPHPVRGSVDAAESLRRRLTKRKTGNCPEDNIPTDAQDLHSWLESRQLELRDALDVHDMESVNLLTGLISRGASVLHSLNQPSTVAHMVH